MKTIPIAIVITLLMSSCTHYEKVGGGGTAGELSRVDYECDYHVKSQNYLDTWGRATEKVRCMQHNGWTPVRN